MNFYELYRLLNEYRSNIVKDLIEKFKKNEPHLSTEIIEIYINEFEKIKNKIPTDKRDITKLSWQELENLVDSNRSTQRIKAGKIDPEVSDSNLLYNKDGIRIYLAKDKKSCIKYSNGYSFCIGSRGDVNMYGYYRLVKRGTPYFIFNDNLPKSNPDHVLVLFVYKDTPYTTRGGRAYRFTITNAKNRRDKSYESIYLITRDFPWTKPITNFVDENKGDIEPRNLEVLEYYLSQDYVVKRDKYVRDFMDTGWVVGKDLAKTLINEKTLNEFINKRIDFAYCIVYINGYDYYDDVENEFYIKYKDENEVLAKIKEKLPLSSNFEYKDFEAVKEQVRKALNNKSDLIAPKRWMKEKEQGNANVVLVDSKNAGDYHDSYWLKIVNIRDLVDKFIQENEAAVKRVKELDNVYSKILLYIRNQSEEKLKELIIMFKKSNMEIDIESLKKFIEI